MVCLCTSCDEGVATLGQDLHQVVSQVATGQIQTHDGVGQSVTLIDGHVVGHTITGVQHNAFEEKEVCQNTYCEGCIFIRLRYCSRGVEVLGRDSPVVRPEAYRDRTA